ncbi:hypothetical protein [Saccharothrix xinjiangensis]|uniref:Small secreted hydrophilic protein n=1 Tax=Saccharothrix xinjiangensis TaxID=204798 RepID=A0ABV9Y379_9PSEU
MPTAPRIALVTAAIALPLGAALVTWALPGEPAPTAPVEVRLRDNAGPDPSSTGTGAPGAGELGMSAPGTGAPGTTEPAPPVEPTATAPVAPPPVVVAPPPPVPPGDDDDDDDGGGGSDDGDD